MKALLRAAYRTLPFKRQAFGLLRTLPLPYAVYQRLHFDGDFTVRVAPGAAFRMVSYGDAVENVLFWAGYSGPLERQSFEIWRRLARLGTGTILDIGANTGIYALAARAVNPVAPVIAFEPIARIAERLRTNVALNGYDIDVVEAAVSDASGTATIHDSEGANNYSASLETGVGENTLGYAVETLTLDDFLERKALPPIDLIKLDVELHEPAAVRGMRATIARSRPAFLVEVLDRQVGSELTELLQGSDYLMFQIHEQDGLVATRQLGPLSDRNWNNLICTRAQFDAAKLVELVDRGR